MSDMPESIWASECSDMVTPTIWRLWTDEPDCDKTVNEEYIRADIAQAKLDRLERELKKASEILHSFELCRDLWLPDCCTQHDKRGYATLHTLRDAFLSWLKEPADD